MMIGDAGKRAKRRDRLDLQLTTRSETNMKLGNFFCESLKKLGFRAYRTKDTRWFYRWVSQVSPFFNWVYKVVLGLKEKETTTYNAIKVDWLLGSPEVIIKRFLQGVYESDGSVNLNKQISCCVCPNSYLIQQLLKRFDIKAYISNRKYKEVIIYSNELKKAHELLFAPEIRTKRYRLLDMVVHAKTLKFNERFPKEIKEEIVKLGKKKLRTFQIQKMLLEKHNFYTTADTVKRVLSSLNLLNNKSI